MSKSKAISLRFVYTVIAICSLAITLFFGSCQQDKTILSQETRNGIIKDVRNTLEQYVSAIEEHGILAELNYLDHSPDFFWIPPGYEHPIYYDSVESVIKLNATRLKSVVNSFDSLQVIPLSERLAIYTGKMQSVTTDTSNQVTEVSLIETGVMIKRKDGWKLLSGQTSLLD
jgi:hypothetical protein